MSQTTAQLLLAALFLASAIIFAIIGKDPLAIALVGAVLGQGTGAAVRSAVNGTNGTK